jgi:hypothetical protein
MCDLCLAAEEDTVAVHVHHSLPVSVHNGSVLNSPLPVEARADVSVNLLDGIIGHEVARADPARQTSGVESAIESTELCNSLLDGGFHLLPDRHVNGEPEGLDTVQLGDLGCCLLDRSLAEIHEADVGSSLSEKV